MADLNVKFAGLTSPNPVWLASGPPTNTAGQVIRAFDAGWGGAVWKTIGEPIDNTSSRYGEIDLNGAKLMGFNNIELISDRPIGVNFREIYEVKKRYPKNLVIASLMIESKRECSHSMFRRPGTEFRVPAWNERARHGIGGWPGARIHGDDYVVGEGSDQDTGHRQA